MGIKTINNKDELFCVMSVLFLATTMIVPSNYSIIRLAIIFVWTVISVAEGAFRIKLIGTIGKTYIFYLMVNLLCFVLGIMNGAMKGAIASFRPYILWPVIFYLIVTRFDREERLAFITKCMITVEFILCVIDIWYCFGSLGWVPAFPGIFDFLTVDFRFAPEMTTVRFSTNHVNTHIFMMPFTVAIAIDDYFKKKHDLKIYVLLLLEAISFYLSGRIALWISTIVAVAVLIGMRIISKKDHKGVVRLLKTVGLVVIVVAVALFITTKYSNRVANAMKAVSDKINNSFTANETLDGTRHIQSQYLIEGWKEHPVFGNGMGTNPEYVRDDTNTWGYEMTYHYILYQGGIVQFIALFVFLGCILWTLWKAYRKRVLPYIYTIPYITGLIAFIVATSVEPYMFKLGAMWIVFIPMGLAVYAEKLMRYGENGDQF